MRPPHDHDHWMRRALALARPWAGRTWPNPTVGCVLVRDGQLLSEGVHEGAGQPHAEAQAIARALAAGIDLRGATAYVTLEPCHHQGRTPPCSRALHTAGIVAVQHAVDDPHPKAAGGAAWLREQGVHTEGGRLGRVAWELNHPFFEAPGQVHITLKLALSLDGRLARRAGRVEDPAERRITGPLAHRRVHRMRAAASAVLVGRQTAAWDRPRLDARGVPVAGQPRPVVLDPQLALGPGDLPAGALVLCAPDAPPARWSELERAGHEPAAVQPAGPGRLGWEGIVERLAERQLGVLLVEGGAAVAADLLAARRAHRLRLFLAPRLLGGDGPGLALPSGATGQGWSTHRLRPCGGDVDWTLRAAGLPAPPP